MGLFTQILNLSATAPAAGITTLSLDFFNVNGAPGAGNLAGLTAAKSAITTPVVDADGNSVTVGNFINFNNLQALYDAPEGQSFVNYSIAVSAASLSAIGSSTGFSILLPGATAATVIPAGADVIATFNAAINALLTGTVDTAGGRAAIQFLAVDALTNDATNTATGAQLLSPGTASLVTTSNLNTHLSETPQTGQDGGQDDQDQISEFIGSANLNVNANQLNGLLRLNLALSGDPAIGEIKMVALKPSVFEGNNAKVMGSIAVDSYDPSTDTFTPPDGLLMANGTPISFNTNLGSVVPNGLTAGTVYYVVNIDPDMNTFQLSATPGGGVIDILGKAVSASSTAGVFTAANNGYNIDDQVKFTGAVAAGGLTPGATYYVVPSSGAEGTFSLSATLGGNPITSTGTAITLTNLTSPDYTTASGTVHALSPTNVSALTFTSTGAATPSEVLPDEDFVLAMSTDFHNGDVVKFSGTTVPGGLVAGTSYFVINSDDAGAFQVSATATGAAINITSEGADVLITKQSAQFSIPDFVDLQVGQSIFFGSAIGTGILANTEYFVRSIGEGTFTVTSSMVFDAETQGFNPGLAVNTLGSSGTIAAGINTGASVSQFGSAGFQSLDALLGLDGPESSPLTQIGGITLDFPSKIAVLNSASSAAQFSTFPLDIPSLNAIGALGNGLTITVNMAPGTAIAGQKLVSQFMSVNLAQADAIASNGVKLNLVGLEPKSLDDLAAEQYISMDVEFAATNVIKIRDSAVNINAMTVEQANNIDAMIHSVMGGTAGDFGPQMIDITPTDIGTAITLSFDVAQALANNDMRIDLKASVATNIAGAFGTVTGEDLLNLVEAGIDRIGFDNSTLAPVLPATVGVDPFAGQNVRNVVLSSQDLAAVSKMAIVGAGLRGNGTIDVSVVVDDSGNRISVPSTLITKMGVDRIIADDGNLDIYLNDARNLLKTGVFLGNAGDKSDVTLIVDNDRDFANLKAPAIVTFAAKGVDVISYDAQIDFINSLSQSKNLIDTISAGIRNGISFDLHGNDIFLNTGFLSMAGVGAGFVSTVNNLSSDIYLETRHNLADGSQGYDSITVEASGIRADWIKVSNYNWWGFDETISISVDDQMNSYASMTKLVAKANATTGAAVLVDMQYGTTELAVTEVLRDVWDGEAGVGVIREMTEFGKIIGTLKNVYGDFRTSGDDENVITEEPDFQSVLMSNLNKMNLKGIVIDDHVLNDYESMVDTFSTTSGDERSDSFDDYMALSSTAQSLDIVYALDATDTSSSLGLSKYVYDQEGNITTSLVDDVTTLNLKNDAFNFRANVNTIDRIVISNASDGDMSIDLSEFGVYGDNWLNSAGDAQDSNFTSMVFRKGQSQDTFELRASSGKLVTLQIVGLTDYTQFSAADLKESPDAWVLTA